MAHNKKYRHQYDEADHQDMPRDFEAQAGQGPITLHSEEHLATSDRGIVMLRRLLKEQIRAVADGHDPVGIEFDAENTTLVPRSELMTAGSEAECPIPHLHGAGCTLQLAQGVAKRWFKM